MKKLNFYHMSLFKYSLKIRSLVIPVLLALMFGCSKDDGNQPKKDLQKLFGIACSIGMSYEVTTVTYSSAADPDEQQLLTPSEQTLSYPTFVKCAVDVCIASDGQLMADIQMLRVADAPDYPTGTIGIQSIPKDLQVDKIEIRNGLATHYDAKGQVLQVAGADESSISFYQSIINDLSEIEPLTAEQMVAIMDGFREANFDVEPVDERYEVLTQPFSDGSYAKVVLDKSLYVISGQANYNSSGELETKSNFTFTGEPGNVTVTGHRFVTYFESPFSHKKMAITRKSKIENFMLTKNL